MAGIEELLCKVFPIFYLMAGTFYNYYKFTNFVVKKYRDENIFIYFLVLAFCDVMVLVMPLLHEWLSVAFNADIRSLTPNGCRIHLWLSGVVMDVPPWVLVVMAYEKRALLWFPVPTDSRFSRRTAKRVMMVLIGLCLLRENHVFWAGVHNKLSVCDMVSHNGTRSTQGSNKDSLGNLEANSTCKPRSAALYVCDVTDKTGIFVMAFMTWYNPWLDLAVRWLGPCLCLFVYNFTIVRKIWRERDCSEKLMEKVGIVPPPWFNTGVTEMESTVRWTGSLAIVMCIITLPKMLYNILQNQHFSQPSQFNPSLHLAAHILFYANHSFLYPTIAVQDNELLTVMQESWRLPLCRKRGTTQASRPPCLIPQHCIVTGPGGFNDANYNNSGFFPPSPRVLPSPYTSSI